MPGHVHPVFRAQYMFTFIHLTGVPELIWTSSCRSLEISFVALARVGPSFTHKCSSHYHNQSSLFPNNVVFRLHR